jgi:hypothetical protein
MDSMLESIDGQDAAVTAPDRSVVGARGWGELANVRAVACELDISESMSCYAE